MQKDFEFIIKSEMQYSQDGNFIKAKKLLLRAPSIKQGKLCAKLQQSYKRALNDQQEKLLKIGVVNLEKLTKEINKAKDSGKKEDAKGFTPKEMIDLLQSSATVDFSDFIEIFKELLLDNTCLIDGKIPMCSLQYDCLGYNELISLMGEYLTNFLL